MVRLVGLLFVVYMGGLAGGAVWVYTDASTGRNALVVPPALVWLEVMQVSMHATTCS